MLLHGWSDEAKSCPDLCLASSTHTGKAKFETGGIQFKPLKLQRPRMRDSEKKGDTFQASSGVKTKRMAELVRLIVCTGAKRRRWISGSLCQENRQWRWLRTAQAYALPFVDAGHSPASRLASLRCSVHCQQVSRLGMEHLNGILEPYSSGLQSRSMRSPCHGSPCMNFDCWLNCAHSICHMARMLRHSLHASVAPTVWAGASCPANANYARFRGNSSGTNEGVSKTPGSLLFHCLSSHP